MRNILVLLLLLSAPFALMAQPANDKAELERKRRETLKEIDLLNRQYNEIKNSKKVSLGQLAVIQRKIDLRNRVIGDINRQVNFINQSINSSYREMRRLQKDLDTLKLNYAQNVVYAYKNRSSYDFLNFLFSASNFNDAIRRVAYMRAYRSYRSTQLDAIYKTEQLYKEKITELTNNKKEKTAVLTEQTKEIDELVKDKQEQSAVVNEFKKKEKEINKTISAKRKQAQQLQASITAVINREIAAARKDAEAKAKAEKERIAREKTAGESVLNEAKASTVPAATNASKATPAPAPAPKKPASYLEYNKEDIALGSSFEGSKGRLPFPVDNGYVSIPFGKYTIPGTNVVGTQDFITIASPSGTAVKSCFDGEVVSVFDVGGMSAVTVRHGKYFTTYSNLSSVSVNKGQTIKTGQVVGRVGTNLDGDGQIDFILTRENQFLNPSSWLRNR